MSLRSLKEQGLGVPSWVQLVKHRVSSNLCRARPRSLQWSSLRGSQRRVLLEVRGALLGRVCRTPGSRHSLALGPYLGLHLRPCLQVCRPPADNTMVEFTSSMPDPQRGASPGAHSAEHPLRKSLYGLVTFMDHFH